MTAGTASTETQPGRSAIGGPVLSSLAQVVISTLVVMALYRYVVAVIGIEGLGAWSLVLAIGSTLQVAVLALPAAVTRLVAGRSPAGQHQNLSALVDTAVLLTTALALVVALPALPAGEWFLGFALTGSWLAPTQALLPLAVAAFVVSMITGAYQAVLYGVERITLRNLILIGDSLVHAALCLVLVRHQGLMGLVWARLATNATTLVVFMIATHRSVPGLALVPHRWDRRAFRELARSGLQLQVISLLVVLAEPVTKGLLGRFGTVAMVGYFEMANRLVQSLRALFVAANQVTLPRFARDHAQAPHRTGPLLATAHRLTLATALPSFAALLVGAPLISRLWLGSSEPGFIDALMILSAGWFLNVLAVPAYFASLGTGQLRSNVISHAVLAAVNLVGGIAMGMWLGGLGVLLAWALALASSALILLWAGFGSGGVPYAQLVPPGLRVPALVAALAVMMGTFAYGPSAWRPADGAAGSEQLSGALALLTLSVIAVTMLVGGMRTELVALLHALAGRMPRQP